MVFQTRIHLVLLRNKLKRLWIWLKISQENDLQREQPCACPPHGRTRPLGGGLCCDHREAHTPPDQGGAEETGSSKCWPQQEDRGWGLTEILTGLEPSHTWPCLWELWETSKGFGQCFSIATNESPHSVIQKKFTVCWFHATNSYTISMGQKIHGFQIKFSVIEDVFTNWCQIVDDNVNTIYSFNCFFPPLLFLLGKIGLSNFCYPSIICFGHQLSMLAATCTCVPIHEMWLSSCLLNWVKRSMSSVTSEQYKMRLIYTHPHSYKNTCL